MPRPDAWTDEEEALLVRYIGEGKMAKDIAPALPRHTLRAIQAWAAKKGYSFKGRRLRKATAEELATIRELVAQRTRAAAIGKVLGRSRACVQTICRRNGISLSNSLREDGWTDEDTEKLRNLRMKGWSRPAIKAELGRSVFAVANKISDLRLQKGTEPMWDDQKVERLRELAPEHTALQIAADLGLTRNSVIGKANRLEIKICGGAKKNTADRKRRYREANLAKGLTVNGKPRAAPGSFKPGPKAKVFGSVAIRAPVRSKKNRSDLFASRGIDWKAPEDPGIKPDAPRGAGPAFLALNGHDCHWPHGDPATDDFTFCYAPRDPDRSIPYCDFHLEKMRAGSSLG